VGSFELVCKGKGIDRHTVCVGKFSRDCRWSVHSICGSMLWQGAALVGSIYGCSSGHVMLCLHWHAIIFVPLAADIANAVLDGVDGILLGAETLRGEYPVESVATIAQICRYNGLISSAWRRWSGICPLLQGWGRAVGILCSY